MYENRIAHLQEGHRVLDKRIDEMERNGNFVDVNLSELKKQRLQLKDEIARLTRLQWEHDHESVDFDDER
jgi:uncharacterized protein YdcH (DUF465 family)